MRVENADARSFYEIEAAKENWSVRWLQRQVGSSLYERIALSRDKNEVLRLATEGQTVEKPSDIIKNPITLEFLGLKPEAAYSETKLESAIISKMQMYVNYYDRNVRQEFEKPTVGILLCQKKNDALVELTLPKDANIYAAQYELYLPDKKELQAKLKSWIEEFEKEEEV